jgi:hypothetical protein
MVFFDILQNYLLSIKAFRCILIILFIKELIEGLLEFFGP